MKLLITTQKVDKNDDVLGFFHSWLLEFAKHFDEITVIALGVGEYDLPENIKVLSLGKEVGSSKLTRTLRFYSYVFKEQSNYDAVFVHMNPEYIVLAGLLWRAWRKKIGLWYVHKSVDLKLRIAEKFVDFIVTASKESFQLDSEKVSVVGHGVDTEKFGCEKKAKTDSITLMSVGRISEIKGAAILLEALAKLPDTYRVVFVGKAGSAKDEEYKETLDVYIAEHNLSDRVVFLGSVPNNEMREVYCDADIILNLTPTGGLDKTVIEGMLSGKPVVVSNETFREPLGKYADMLMFPHGDSEILAEKIGGLEDGDSRHAIGEELSRYACKNFGVATLIDKIAQFYRVGK